MWEIKIKKNKRDKTVPNERIYGSLAGTLNVSPLASVLVFLNGPTDTVYGPGTKDKIEKI